MDKIFKFQKWAVRTVSNSHYRRLSSAPLFQSLNVFNVYDIYKLEVGVFMFSTLQTNCQMGFEIHFQNKLNVINILTEMPMTIL